MNTFCFINKINTLFFLIYVKRRHIITHYVSFKMSYLRCTQFLKKHLTVLISIIK